MGICEMGPEVIILSVTRAPDANKHYCKYRVLELLIYFSSQISCFNSTTHLSVMTTVHCWQPFYNTPTVNEFLRDLEWPHSESLTVYFLSGFVSIFNLCFGPSDLSFGFIKRLEGLNGALCAPENQSTTLVMRSLKSLVNNLNKNCSTRQVFLYEVKGYPVPAESGY